MSLTRAIERGIRRGKKASDYRGKRGDTAPQNPGGGFSQTSLDRSRPPISALPRTSRKVNEDDVENSRVDPIEDDAAVTAIPYSHANSQFLWGTFAVQAALAAGTRQLYKLYILDRGGEGQPRDGIDPIEQDAKRAEVEIVRLSSRAWSRLFFKAGRKADNGYMLEASPIPTTILKGGLKRQELPTATDSNVKPRYPLCLFLDQVLDPGNVGAIVRSAYFFGVDKIIVPQHDTAPLDGWATKASAGATEYLSILRVRDEVDFIKKSKENGWWFYGAMAGDGMHRPQRPELPSPAPVSAALSTHPTVLVLGSESEGIRPKIVRLLDEKVTIGTSASHPGLDSLNVSAAASILIRDFVSPSN